MIELKSVAIFFIWVEIMSYTKETRIRYLLRWKNDISYTHNNMINMRRDNEDGRQIFFDNKCIYNNCYITDDRDLFGIGEITKFDAILFNGHELSLTTTTEQLPKKRSLRQKYIVVCAEPICLNMSFVCNPIFQGYFNMTMTLSRGAYEIRVWQTGELSMKYNELRSSDRNIDYTFCKTHLNYDETLLLRNKKKAVAWFMSNCSNSEEIMAYVRNLTISLKSLLHTLDIYGCGHLECSKLNNSLECDDKLRDEYFFYLDFDNSVLKKTNRCPLAKLANNSVPIFYGFDTRYLPLGTYMDAKPHLPAHLAAQIVYLINNPKKYGSYFWYRNISLTYFPVNVQVFPCRLCSAMNSEEYFHTKNPHTCHYGTPYAPTYNEWCNFYINNFIPKRQIG